jgi:UDP-GlcNAc:undecaprenyl-phosphate GlcNAc-1-phosphate transferase
MGNYEITLLNIFIPFSLSVVFVFFVKKLAEKKKFVAYPREDRWNRKAITLLGGIGIFCAFILSYIIFFHTKFGTYHSIEAAVSPQPFLSILVGSCLAFVLGLLDDLMELKPHTKFIGQLVISGFIVFWGFRLGWVRQPIIDMLLTIFWIVGIINSFNLIDNMDGLSSIVAIIASIAYAIIYHNLGLPWAKVGLLIAGAVGGFLIYNFPPASIFMGDSGSLFIGYLLSVIPLINKEVHHNATPFKYIFIPILILVIPIFDTTLVTINRFIHNIKISTGGRDHTSHRLVMIGFSERKTLGLFTIISLSSSITAWAIVRTDRFFSIDFLIPFFLISLLLGIFVSQVQVYPDKSGVVFDKNKTSLILFEWMYKKQLFFILFDLLIISFSYYLSYKLRFPGGEFQSSLIIFIRTLPLVIICKMITFYFFGIYSHFWAFMSIEDTVSLVKANLLGSISTIVILTFIYRFQHISRVTFVLDFFFCVIFMGSFRFSKRVFGNLVKRKGMKGKRVLIYGAGVGGDLLVRELLNNKNYGLNPRGFIDDDPLKIGKKMHGIKIYGPINSLEGILDRYNIEGIIVSFKVFEDKDNKFSKLKELAKSRGIFIKKFNFVLDDM